MHCYIVAHLCRSTAHAEAVNVKSRPKRRRTTAACRSFSDVRQIPPTSCHPTTSQAWLQLTEVERDKTDDVHYVAHVIVVDRSHYLPYSKMVLEQRSHQYNCMYVNPLAQTKPIYGLGPIWTAVSQLGNRGRYSIDTSQFPFVVQSLHWLGYPTPRNCPRYDL